MRGPDSDSSDLLLYGSIALSIAAGGLLLAYLLVRRHSDRLLTPLERAAHLIENCETRIQAIQDTVHTMQSQLQEDGKLSIRRDGA